MGRVLLGIVLGVAIVPLCALGWLYCGHPPAAVGDKPMPAEKLITELPLRARIAAEKPKSTPPSVDEANLVAGAEIYRDHCAACHGFHNKPVPFAAQMSPIAPQYWNKNSSGNLIGAGGQSQEEIFWKISNGIYRTGMPAYKNQLTGQEIWQVTLLIENADKPLPPAAFTILHPQPALPDLPAPQ